MPETMTRSRSRRPAAAPAGADDATQGGLPLWLKGVAPLALLALLVVALLRVGPIGMLRGDFPPVEELTIERVTFPQEGELRVRVVNGGPEPVTIAQVLVDDAVWLHTLDGDRTIPRLGSRVITVPYPWVEGEPHAVTLVTSTGLTFEHTIDVATRTPRPDGRYLGAFALVGVYVGVIPVFLGLLWLPFIRAIGRRWVDFFLALTVGLLVFLGADAFVEAVEISHLVPGAFQGLGLVVLGVVGAPLLIHALGHLRPREQRESALGVATMIAVAIGLHNLGEGLAIGAAYASGAVALGAVLVLGFLIHNTTEGLGIVAPLSSESVRLSRLAGLGVIAGLPTVLGAWIGGFSYSPFWTTLFLAVGVGAIAQVVYVLGRRLFAAARLSPLTAVGLVCGLVVMYTTGLFVAA